MLVEREHEQVIVVEWWFRFVVLEEWEEAFGLVR